MTFFADISLYWLIPWAIVCVVLAYFYYRKQRQVQGISSWLRSLLTGLRATALFLLGLLLFSILIESNVSKLEKPVMIVLVDNSSSMLNYKDSSQVQSKIKDFEKRLSAQYSDKFDVVTYNVDEAVNTDGFNFNGSVSNLDAGFQHIYNQYYNRNIGGICFISDGNFNKGNSPQYTAEKIALTPIFSVGVGDTVRKQDQLISNVAANDIAFYKNQFPIEVDIEASKMADIDVRVNLLQEGEVIATETVEYSGEPIEFKHVSFIVEANRIGFVNYTIQLENVASESTWENNSRSIYVEVIDSRSKILMLSQSPHPDIAAIKQVLDQDANAEVTSQLIEDWDGSLKDVELLVWHGAGVKSNPGLTDAIKKTNVPVWYIAPVNASSNQVAALGIGLKIPADRRTDNVQGYANSGFQLFEVSEKVDQMLEKAPPVAVKYGTINAEGGSSLLSQRIGPVKKKDPIFLFGNTSKSKYAAFLGEGLWRWRLSEYARTKKHEGFEELIQKTAQYLVVKKNTDPFRVNLPKRFTINDAVYIQAEFYNEAFEPIVTPDIQLELKNENNRVIPYTFAKNSKDYSLGLGKLAAGRYSWKASTKFDGKSYTKEGVFIVEDVSLESLATNADHNLLRLMSDASSGKFYSLNGTDQLLKDIGKRDDIVTISYEETDYSDLIDWKWIFALVALLLATEWFLRRYYGSY
ncbi:hypothetical protein N9Y60_01725 [Crocinitomicaceae bacterium]|nr:hypothetical protein [Crocinitomicaceae bacterium]